MADDIGAPAGSETLADWLRRQLERDAEIARAAITKPHPIPKGLGPGVWRQGSGGPYVERVEGDDLDIYDEGGHSEEHAAHIARHDPARVLRDVASKRAILDLHGRAHRCPNHLETDVEPCDTVLLLAAPFTGEDGWNPSWAVES